MGDKHMIHTEREKYTNVEGIEGEKVDGPRVTGECTRQSSALMKMVKTNERYDPEEKSRMMCPSFSGREG